MKKALSVCIAVLLAFSVCGLAAFAARSGDLDADNNVTAADARLILRAAVGLDTLTEAQKQLADLDMDGKITAADARMALRIAVGLDRAVNQSFGNEYEILLSSNYHTEFVFTSDGTSQEFTLAVTPITRYNSFILSDPEGELTGLKMEISLSLLYAEDGRLYLMDHEKKCYGDWDSLLDYMNSLSDEPIDREEFLSDFFPPFFTFLRPLSEASSVGTESRNGKACRVYTFRDSSGSYKVYLNGKKLVSIVLYNNNGSLVSTFDFSKVELVVPIEYCSVPSSYEEEDVLLMLLEIMGADLSEI